MGGTYHGGPTQEWQTDGGFVAVHKSRVIGCMAVGDMSYKSATKMFSVLVALMGCSPKINPGGDCPTEQPQVTYAGQVKSFLAANCISCHSSTATNRFNAPTNINFDSYAEAVANQEQANQDILGGRMPPYQVGLADPNTKCLFDAWVQDGNLP